MLVAKMQRVIIQSVVWQLLRRRRSTVLNPGVEDSSPKAHTTRLGHDLRVAPAVAGDSSSPLRSALQPHFDNERLRA